MDTVHCSDLLEGIHGSGARLASHCEVEQVRLAVRLPLFLKHVV